MAHLHELSDRAVRLVEGGLGEIDPRGIGVGDRDPPEGLTGDLPGLLAGRRLRIVTACWSPGRSRAASGSR